MNSMTGFGRAVAQTEKFNIIVEISGVNRKQTEIAVNVPRAFASWDVAVRASIQGLVSRGRVGVSVSLEKIGETNAELTLDEVKLQALTEQMNRAYKLTGVSFSPTLSDLVKLDILTDAGDVSVDADELWGDVEPVLKSAMGDFLNMRATEGANLKADVLSRLETLAEYRGKIAEHAPSVPLRLRDAMMKRLEEAELPVALDDERIIKELAFFADKCDVSEEIARLASHFEQFRALCESEASAGRPLDFLCQEIFREFNTIGSKANDSTLAHLVVSAKTELEKIREQVQNIE